MSEDFLSRWSRRKREVAAETKAEKRAPTPTDEPAGAASDETALAHPSAAEANTVPTELPFDLASLPPIESITAATDIRPFLAPGVPLDIARAALRRAWSADPVIRDFVGLAENSWDYNTPGSMAGFGPLEMTEELRQAVARIVGGESAQAPGDPPASASDDAQAVPEPESPVVAAADDDRGVTSPAPVNSQDVAASSARPAAPASNQTVKQQEPVERDISPSIVHRNHGGALPK